jgi:hypothetical protein
MMTIQFSATVPDWRNEAEKWRNLAQQTDTAYRNLVAVKVALEAQAQDDRRRWDEQKALSADDFANTLEELNDFKTRLAKAEGDLSAQSAAATKFSAELSIAQASASKAREHLVAVEERNLYLEKANADLNASLTEKIATITVLDQEKRQQEQQINLLKQEHARGSGRSPLDSALREDLVLPRNDKVRAEPPARAVAIRGQISELDGSLASISVGTNDGVEVGMTFIIYNNQGDFLADLEITEVLPNSSAGDLKFVSKPISIGDIAEDEHSYMKKSS